MSGNVSEAAYEALIQFLYQAPIALVQTTFDGEVEMINPTSAQLLMPLSSDGSLDNLFDLLKGVAPELRGLAQAAPDEGDVICNGLRFTSPGGSAESVKTLSISIVRLDGGRLMRCLTMSASKCGRTRNTSTGACAMPH